MKPWLPFIANNLSQKGLLYFLTALFLAGSIFLFNLSDRNMDPSRGKDWWAIEFAAPKSDSLDFIIENYSRSENFDWEVSVEKDKVTGSRMTVQKGAQKKIALDLGSLRGKKVLIVVSNGQDKKEIYKNL